VPISTCSRKSVFRAVISFPSLLYPRKCGPFFISIRSFSSVGRVKKSFPMSHTLSRNACSMPKFLMYRNPMSMMAWRRSARRAGFVEGSSASDKSRTGMEANEVAMEASLCQTRRCRGRINSATRLPITCFHIAGSRSSQSPDSNQGKKSTLSAITKRSISAAHNT